MRKPIRILLISVILLLMLSPATFINAASYQSKSSITFIKDESEEAEDYSSDIPSGEIEKSQELSSDKLPVTATNNYNLILAGLSLLIIGGIILLIYNQKKK